MSHHVLGRDFKVRRLITRTFVALIVFQRLIFLFSIIAISLIPHANWFLWQCWFLLSLWCLSLQFLIPMFWSKRIKLFYCIEVATSPLLTHVPNPWLPVVDPWHLPIDAPNFWWKSFCWPICCRLHNLFFGLFLCVMLKIALLIVIRQY